MFTLFCDNHYFGNNSATFFGLRGLSDFRGKGPRISLLFCFVKIVSLQRELLLSSSLDHCIALYELRNGVLIHTKANNIMAKA